MNWRGRPLTSHEVIVSTIAAIGLTVRAELDTGAYPAGVTISPAEMDALPLDRHHWHGEWNYTLHPAPPGTAAPPQPAPAPPRPDLAWLAHPAITGLTGPALDALTTPPPRCAKPPATAAAGTGPAASPAAPAAPSSPSPARSPPPSSATATAWLAGLMPGSSSQAVFCAARGRPACAGVGLARCSHAVPVNRRAARPAERV